MTHLEMIAAWFMRRGGRATLRDILNSGEPWMHEWNARKTDLRGKGFVVLLERGKTKSDNLYTVIPPEANGQMRIAI